jgi:hypothetical protein
MSQISNGVGDLEAVIWGGRGDWYESQRCRSRFGLFDLEAFVAATA